MCPVELYRVDSMTGHLGDVRIASEEHGPATEECLSRIIEDQLRLECRTGMLLGVRVIRTLQSSFARASRVSRKPA